MKQYAPQNWPISEPVSQQHSIISQLCDGDHVNRDKLRREITYGDMLSALAQIKKSAQ